MDKMVIIPLNLFKLEQEIMIAGQDGTQAFAQVELAHLPEVVVEACNVHNTDQIKLIGNGNYAEALANEIKEYAMQNYSNTNLNISIMEA